MFVHHQFYHWLNFILKKEVENNPYRGSRLSFVVFFGRSEASKMYPSWMSLDVYVQKPSVSLWWQQHFQDQIKCQECQKDCQNICQVEGQTPCQNICQIECQSICQKEIWQLECQIEGRNVCQRDCQIECQNICEIGCQNKCHIECKNICEMKCACIYIYRIYVQIYILKCHGGDHTKQRNCFLKKSGSKRRRHNVISTPPHPRPKRSCKV